MVTNIGVIWNALKREIKKSWYPSFWLKISIVAYCMNFEAQNHYYFMCYVNTHIHTVHNIDQDLTPYLHLILLYYEKMIFTFFYIFNHSCLIQVWCRRVWRFHYCSELRKAANCVMFSIFISFIEFSTYLLFCES